jgi:predicted nucleotidyltransferase
VAEQLHPSVARIAAVARALGDLSNDVVFIGAALAPLLQTNPVIPRVRPTNDVDAIVASSGYASYNVLEARIRARGFRTAVSEQQNVHRWRAPDGTLFDLVPIGAHLGGTGGRWDAVAFDTAVETEVEAGVRIRHASAPGFLALKWAAFWDRGARDPFGSPDLEDILALMVSRDELVSEFNDSPPPVQDYIREGLSWLRGSENYEDLVAAHLGNAMAFTQVAESVGNRIRVMMGD